MESKAMDADDAEKARGPGQDDIGSIQKLKKWSFGVLNDKQTDEVPGSILLLSKVSQRQEPLGLQHAPARLSASSLPNHLRPAASRTTSQVSIRFRKKEKKRTPDGAIILEPQPEESVNDPLNWPIWRRNAALLSLGFYCMLGGGMTPILAAGFEDVAATYKVTTPQVALTTGLYMLGLGIGSVVLSPTAILYGKRPVYLSTSVIFILSSIWCALSPSYVSLLVARIVQGIAVSPVECLPSASIAEIFFLHERAYRLGVYTLLLLGGKNLIPLVSAAIIESLGWRWVFWIVSIVVGFGGVMLLLFVPETFWDRTPSHLKREQKPKQSKMSVLFGRQKLTQLPAETHPKSHNGASDVHVSFTEPLGQTTNPVFHGEPASQVEGQESKTSYRHDNNDGLLQGSFTDYHRHGPRKTYVQTLKPYAGRLSYDGWLPVAIRPFILFAYPAVLWSALVYSLSVGWLIVLSESMSHIYRDRNTYNFTSLQTGLVYLSPFIGGVLGTAVAGKLSDVIVRFMSRHNDGIYEPEFRLVMGIPIAVCTTIGLMGFGWSVEEHDHWIVPTVFFGIISFGCSLGSTTSITFCVDSYRQYAGEALVTLNFSKNVLHGFVFSLFFNKWLEKDGPKLVFIAIGVVQMGCLLTTIPLYIYGKRARMFTVRKNWIEHA